MAVLCNNLFERSLVNPKDLFHGISNVVVKIPNYVYWKNRRLQYMGCNNNFARIAKLNSPADIAGKTDHEIRWNSASAEELIEHDQQVIKTGSAVVSESTLLVADDESQPIYIRTHRTPIHNKDGDVVCVVGVTTDISVLKQLEQQLKKLSSRDFVVEKFYVEDEAQEVVIDWYGCRHMCQDNPVFVNQMLSSLVEQIKKYQKTFTQAYAAKDIAALRAELHSCIGEVCYIRLPQLEGALNDLQTAVQDKPQDSDLNKLEIPYRALQKAMENFLRAMMSVNERVGGGQ